jgi:hypothetical protein
MPYLILLPLGNIIGLYCATHRKHGMINVIDKKCEFAAEGCTKQPVFNLPGETIRKYCSSHRENGMIDIKNKKCEFAQASAEGCTKIPTYNLPGEKKLTIVKLIKKRIW